MYSNKKTRNKNSLTKDQINNKKLVSLLKHKIFRGYIDIKNSKTFFRKKPKFVKTIDFEENNLEPFDDNYNLQYKRTYLSKLNSKINNPLQIKNISFPMTPTTEKKEKMSQTLNQNFFLTNSKLNEYYKYNKLISDRNKVIFNEMFQDSYEANIYSNIPFLYVERAIQKPENSNERLIISEGKDYGEYDGLTENQFIYKISHKNIQSNPEVNSFKTNKGIKRGFTSRRVKSAFNKKNFKKNTDNNVNKDNMKIKGINVGVQLSKISYSNVSDRNKSRNFSFKNNNNNLNHSKGINNIHSNNIKKFDYNSLSSDLNHFNSPSKKYNNLKKSNFRLTKSNYKNNEKIITNQLLIDENNFKKYKFNLLKEIMQGNIE